MEDIVRKIIDMDARAEEKLENARKMAKNIIDESQNKQMKYRDEVRMKIDSQLEILRKAENEKCGAALAKLDEEYNSDVCAEDAVFEKYSERIVSEIFDKIISVT